MPNNAAGREQGLPPGQSRWGRGRPPLLHLPGQARRPARQQRTCCRRLSPVLTNLPQKRPQGLANARPSDPCLVAEKIPCGWMAARLGRSGSPQDSMEATDADRSPRDHAAGRADDAKLFASLELSKSRWLVTVSAPGSEKLSKHAVSGGD